MSEERNPQENTDQQKEQLAQQILQEDATSSGVGAESTQQQPQTGLRRFLSIKKLLIIFGIIMLLLIITLAISRFGDNTFTPTQSDGEVVWWTVKEDVESLRPLVDEFEDQNPNVRVVLKPQSETDYVERLTNALSSNNPPEIFEIHKSWVPMFRQRVYSMPNTVGDVGEFERDFYPVISSDLVNDSGLAAMPLYYDALAFYINQDIFTRAAVTPPETWIELESLAGTLTQRDRNGLVSQSGVAMGYSSNIDYWQEVVALLMYQNGVNIQNPSGERAAGVFNFYRQFESVWDTRLPSSTDYFAQGNVAMYFGPTLEASYIIQQNPNLRFRTELLPQVPKGSPDDPDFSYTTYYVNSVSASSGDRDVAWQLLKFLTQDDQLMKLNEERESRGLYPRIYPKIAMGRLQNADPILGSVIAMAHQARGWYLNDDQIEGENSLTDQVSSVYSTALSGSRVDFDSFQSDLRRILNSYGIRTN